MADDQAVGTDWLKRVWAVLDKLSQQVADIAHKVSGDHEGSHSWQLREASREIADLKTEVAVLKAAQEKTAADLAALSQEIAPIKEAVTGWQQWQNKVLGAVVIGIVMMVLTGVGGFVWLGFALSVKAAGAG